MAGGSFHRLLLLLCLLSVASGRHRPLPSRVASLYELRGGDGIAVEDNEQEQEQPPLALIATKFRNVVRSLLEIGDRKAPALSKLVRKLLQKVERLTGFKILPKKKKSEKKKKKKQQASLPKEKKEKKQQAASPITKKKKKKVVEKKADVRILRELKDFVKSPPSHLSVRVLGANVRVWIVTLQGVAGTVYEGETYKLRISFPPQYPTVPPSVYFLSPVPKHEHVYTNGDICLSLLGKGWRPTMTAQSIAVSILSILSSARAKSIPMDNARHAQNKPGQYQKDWIYHDDNC